MVIDSSSAIVLINEETIRDRIYIVRGQKVMLDFELASIYGYETKNFNRQVKNNSAKFDGEDFMFRLTADELKILRCKNSTSSWGGARYLPYAFTEQGIYMLMTVLRGDLAIRQSKALIRTFRMMKDYIIENQGLIGQREYLQLSMQTSQNVRDIMAMRIDLNNIENKVADVVNSLSDVVVQSDLSVIMLDFGSPQVRRDYLLLNGEPAKADLAYSQIYSEAEKTIFIIDNYIGLKTLVLLKSAAKDVSIVIFSDNIGKGLHSLEYNDFKKEYPNITVSFRKTNGMFHDRYIILDFDTDKEKIYHCGASSKDAGNRVTTITEVPEKQVYYDLIKRIQNNPSLIM